MESIGQQEISTLKSLVDRMQKTTVEMKTASQDYDTDSTHNFRPRKKLHFTSSDFDLNKSSTDGNSSDCSSLYSTASVNSYLKNYTNVYKSKSINNYKTVSQTDSPTNYVYENLYSNQTNNFQKIDNIYSSSTNSAYSSSSNINTCTITKNKNKFKDPNLMSKSFLPINTIEDLNALENLKNSLKYENLSDIDKIIHDNALLRLCLPKWVNNKSLPDFETKNLNFKVKNLISGGETLIDHAEIDDNVLNHSETLIDSNESKTDLNSTIEYKKEEVDDSGENLDQNDTIILDKTVPRRKFSPLPSTLVKNIEMNSLNSPIPDTSNSISSRKSSLDFTATKSSTPRIKNLRSNYQKRLLNPKSNSRETSPAPAIKPKSSISRRCTSSISPTNKPKLFNSTRLKTTKPTNLGSRSISQRTTAPKIASNLTKTKLSKVSSNKLNDSLKSTGLRSRNFSPLPSKASFNQKSGNVSLNNLKSKSNYESSEDFADPRLKHLPHGGNGMKKEIDENNNTVKPTGSTDSLATKKTKRRLPGPKSTKSFGFRGKK